MRHPPERTNILFRRRDRLASGMLALGVQAGLIALLIVSHAPRTPPERFSHELTLILPRLRQIEPPIERAAPPRTPTFAPVRPPSVQPSTTLPPFAVPIPQTPSQEQLRGVGQSLFGCAPETWSSLTPEQRAHCSRPGEGMAVQDAPNLLGGPNHVKDEAHWQEEWAREKSPALLPCAGFVDVMCLLSKIANGSLSDYGDPGKWPHYEVRQLSKEDMYRLEQAYAAWDRRYGKKPAPAVPAPSRNPSSPEGVSVHPQ